MAEDLHFRGGEYGILTKKTAPSWPFVLLDSSFEGQRVAAIRTEEAGMTIVRDRFRNVPTVVSIDPDRAEELWIEDSRFEDVSGPALVVSDERNPRTQVNLQNVVCERVPLLVRFRESGKEIAGAGPLYVVKDFSHGLEVADMGAPPAIGTTLEAAPLARRRRPCRPTSRRCPRRRPGSACAASAPWGTAAPTTRRSCARRSPSIARSSCPPAATGSRTRSRCERTRCWSGSARSAP